MLIARAQAAVFFALLLLYAWLRLDPSLAYHCQQPLFFTGTAHLWAHLGFPGGPLEYVGAWLSQLLFYPWAGAALTAVSARLVGRAVGAWVTTAGRPRSPLWEMGPAALVLAQHSHCTHPIHLDLATAAGVAVAVAYGRHAPRAAAPRLAVFAALAALLWYAAYPAVALFAALAGLLEIRQTRRWPAALVCFAAIPLAALAYGYWRWLALGPALLALCPPLETWLADGGLDRAVPGILLYLLVAGSAIWPVRRPGAARPAQRAQDSARRPSRGPQAAPDAGAAPAPPPAAAPARDGGAGRQGQTGVPPDDRDVSPPGASSSETTGVWTPDG